MISQNDMSNVCSRNAHHQGACKCENNVRWDIFYHTFNGNKRGMVALGVPPYFCWENNLSMHVTANPGVK
jgi:hypothetical protein